MRLNSDERGLVVAEEKGESIQKSCVGETLHSQQERSRKATSGRTTPAALSST